MPAYSYVPRRLHSEQISFPVWLTKMSISLLAFSLGSDAIEAIEKRNKNSLMRSVFTPQWARNSMSRATIN